IVSYRLGILYFVWSKSKLNRSHFGGLS
ncbi:uncharacterized protein METZ01_LOCUS329991, partial [marine metagenome]